MSCHQQRLTSSSRSLTDSSRSLTSSSNALLAPQATNKTQQYGHTQGESGVAPGCGA